MQSVKNTPEHRYQNVVIYGIALYILIQITWFFYHGVFINIDSIEAYIPQSKISLFSKDFFTGGNYIATAYGMKARAYSYPLYLKLFPHTDRGLYLATVGQFLISLISWLYFAAAISKRGNNKKLAMICFFSILLVSLTNGVLVWNRSITAESLTISSFLWVIILFIKWSDVGCKLNFFLSLLVFISLFFAGLRDTNPYFLLLLGFFSLGYALANRSFCVGILIFSSITTIIFWGNNFILEKTNRWQAPFGATFVGRLLCQSDQSAVHYFQNKYNMPNVPESLKLLRGTLHGWDYIDLSKEPLAKWMRQYGKTAYIHYLLSHPYYTGIVPLLPIKNNFNQCPDITKNLFSIGSGFKNIGGKQYEIDYQRSLWFSLISTSNVSVTYEGKRNTSWPTILMIPIVDTICIIALVGFFWLIIKNKLAIKQFDKEIMLSLFLFLSGIVMALLIWHADASAYPRHLILTVHQLCLSALMLFFFSYDKTHSSKNDTEPL